MGYFINNQNIVDNSRNLAPGKFTNRASLPSPSTLGYLAYISDQNDLAVGGIVNSMLPDIGNTWYKFMIRPLDYKNEVILSQGVIGGGGAAGEDRNTIQQMIYSVDTIVKLVTTLPVTTAYGGGHGNKLHAYYHQGRDTAMATAGKTALKNDWATYSIQILPERPNCFGANINTTQPGPVIQNTFGVVMQGTASCYITFSTDTWTVGGYNAPSTGTGWATYSGNYGYNYSGSGDLYRLTFPSGSWASTGAGGPPNGGGAGKVLNTKWGKFYNGGGKVDRYTEASNSWSIAANSPNGSTPGSWQEQTTLMAQDWGYWCGFSDTTSGTAYYKITYQHHYATETLTASITISNLQATANMGVASISFPTVAGCSTQGP